jgi:hypothetical protein
VIIESDEEWLILASKTLENAQSFLAFFWGGKELESKNYQFGYSKTDNFLERTG